jgi:hypothetical protein
MISAGELMAQQPVLSHNDSINLAVAKLTKSVQILDRIKFSGFIQAQYQLADTLGAKSYNGGDFPAASAQRFMVRRGYFKMTYIGKLSTYVFQINVNEKGFNIRDAYFSITEPWLKAFTLKGGVFYRPFGQEVSYSTPLRESPELARVTQLLFPGERDLGASVTFQMPENSPLHVLKVDAGLFAGNGPTAETDDKLDFMGRVGYADNIKKHNITYGLGISYYNGSIYQAKKDVYEMSDFNGLQAFRQRIADTIPGNYFKRRYIGFDGQFSFQSPLGKTTFRGDFVVGDQPGSDKTSSSPVAAIDYSLYLRKFNGGVFYLVQSVYKNMHSVVLKYDFYDPNTEISGDEIGKKATSAKATNGTDIAYTTWGFGWITDFNQNLRLMLYYDLVKNETSKNLSGFTQDLKDNIFTIRVQYKF